MIGIALLPENLHVDLGLADYISRQKTTLLSGQQPDGVRLWAKHFALVGNMQGLQVPQPWSDLFRLWLYFNNDVNYLVGSCFIYVTVYRCKSNTLFN
jgi:hypothetical protein